MLSTRPRSWSSVTSEFVAVCGSEDCHRSPFNSRGHRIVAGRRAERVETSDRTKRWRILRCDRALNYGGAREFLEKRVLSTGHGARFVPRPGSAREVAEAADVAGGWWLIEKLNHLLVPFSLVLSWPKSQ
jgi:hypothetical protein